MTISKQSNSDTQLGPLDQNLGQSIHLNRRKSDYDVFSHGKRNRSLFQK